MAERRKFRREGEERRRQDLIEATLGCVAEHGIEGATVRAIALRAGVTAGLIRHYFPGKEELLQAAYATIVERMTAQALASLRETGRTPAARLAAFVAANLTPPIVDARVFSLWAGFIGRAHADPALSAVHRDGYIGFRDQLEHLVAETLAAERRTADAGQLRRHAIAVNAIIDGLWIEGCMAGDLFETGELAAIGVASVGRELGIDIGDGDA
jgi:AcrR family transcriptional regulator